MLSLAILIIPNFVSADCVELARYDNSMVEDTHAVIFYAGKRALARVKISDCEVRPLSTIRLLGSYVCDSDQIFIDGEPCNILSVELID